MTYLLLLVDAEGVATTPQLIIRQQREFPGNTGLSVHFRPVRNDLLFESAKVAGHLAYRVLSGEGIVRSQLWVEYEVLGAHINVTGRSSDLLFALALVTSKWKRVGGSYPAIAATGMLDSESATLSLEHAAVVQSVQHTAPKVAAAVRALSNQADAVVFYPSADADSVEAWAATTTVPAHVHICPVSCLEDALAYLGITLEKVYLGNPFRGLEYFGYEHRSIFFGRDSEVREVVEQLLRREAGGVPGILVEGASGSGKSSFLRAGVLPALVNPSSQRADVESFLRIRPVRDTVKNASWRLGLLPTGAPESKIAESIRDCWRALPELADRLDGEYETLGELAAIRQRNWPGTQRFVWLVDQFEELFIIGLGDSDIDRLGQFLIQLQADGVWTLASIRADAVPLLKQHQSLRQVFGSNEGQYYLERMSGTALDDVISRPAAAAGLTFGLGLSGQQLDRVLREEAYRDRENALPLLQFTLRELYEMRSARELTFAAYEQLGGLSGSVATAAESTVHMSEEESKRAATPIFRSLVSVDDVGRSSRRYAAVAEIVTDPAQKRLLDRLVTARLCVTDQHDGVAVVAFAHEALLRTWPALVEWLKQEAGLLQTRELAQHETRLWQEHGESDAWLAAADKLAAFKTLETAGIALAEPVRQFIERAKRRVRRTTRIKQAAVSLIALLAIVASSAGWIASRKQREAEYQTSQALQTQARLLTQAAAQRLKDGDVSGAQDIILEVLTNPEFAQGDTPAAISVFQEVRAADAQLAVLSGHGDVVESAAYSPDGTRIVTASADNARIWDTHTGAQLAVLSGHGDGVKSAAYSPDGTRIVTASFDRTARIWDARSGVQLAVLSGHGDDVQSAAYSPDGTRIVTASFDKTARIWDARSGVQLAVLSGHGDLLNSAAYSPDGTRIVTASFDKTARIWDLRTGAQLAVLSGHGGIVESAAYSPDGMRIVTAAEDNARIWDARTGAQLAVLSGHGDGVNCAAYSPDGTRIVTASADKTARIWDARSGAQLAVLSGHGSVVVSAAYSPDGTRIVTASEDKNARIWDARVGAQLAALSGHGDHVETAAYSPDGTRIVTASADKTARIWDTRTGAQLTVLSGHGSVVLSAAYSPDGTRIVTASVDKTARIWDARTGSQLTVLSGHGSVVVWAAYSLDGTRIVTASLDKTARIWDARTGAQLAVLSGHGDVVESAAYSPDGTRIVTASDDKTARIWDARTGAQLAVLSGHGDGVEFAAYSPDGTRIVTASLDKTARIWDARVGTQLAMLSGHGDDVKSAAYSPDGTRIVTASRDKTARIWDARTGAQLAVLSGHGNNVNTAAYSRDGTRIVTASLDSTARIWDARVPANIEAQILWDASAQTDSLTEVDRIELGLSPNLRARTWSKRGSACDQAAAAFYDPDRWAPGAAQSDIKVEIANSACSAETIKSKHFARLDYQMGRASLAKHDVAGARRQFELAVSKDYRAARVDLANLLVDVSSGMFDPKRAVLLYEKAWRDGVLIAAFELGHLYEDGDSGSDAVAPGKSHPDLARAWSWYQKGEDAGEPNATARFAERDDHYAVAERDPSKKNALLLQAFRLYAAAAERAHDEDWPEDAWRNWRYRRATLARLLAREGMMQQVADAYTAIRR